jgi:fumarate reductase subunit D
MKFLLYFFSQTFTGAVFILIFGILYYLNLIYFNIPKENSRYFNFVGSFVLSFGLCLISLFLMYWRISHFLHELFN